MSAMYSSRRARRNTPPFKPSDRQKRIAKYRILHALDTYDEGEAPIKDFDDAVDLLCGKVFNRDGELGRTKKEFRKTIRASLLEMIYDEKTVTVDVTLGVIRLLVKIKSTRRRHRQKYPNKRRMAYA